MSAPTMRRRRGSSNDPTGRGPRNGRGRGKEPAPVNPFLPPPQQVATVPEPIVTDPLLGRDLAATGPARPIGLDAPAGPGLARAFTGPDTRTRVVGLHGGAGTSTLAHLLGAQVATDEGVKTPIGGTPRVVFVARTHAAGLAAIRYAGQVWAAHQLDDITVLGLVLVDDGPRIGREQLAACRAVMRVFPRTWRIGWVEPWRTHTVPDPRDAPLRTRRTLHQLHDLSARRAVDLTKDTP